MRILAYISFFLFVLASCQKFTWNNPYDIATPKSVFTPDGLAVRQEGENLLLSWSQDNSNISGFKLFRAIDKGVSSEIATLNKSTLSYTDANVQGGRTYTYTLKAYADKNESNDVSTEIIAKSRPIVNTIAASLITENTATVGGAIVSDGGSSITTKGLVWSTSVNPTIDLTTKTNDGSGSGAFERILTNLSPNTIYYVRAYATNGVGTAYGNQISFTTSKPPAPPILESLTQGLVAYYPFNGNANDESGNGNDATNFGATLSTDRFGVVNKSYNFNGINNYMNVSYSTSIGIQKSFSSSVWINMSGGSCNPRVYELHEVVDCGGYTLMVMGTSNTSRTIDANFGSCTGPNTSLLNNGISLSAGVWHHISVTVDGVSGTGKLYIDGVLVFTKSGTPITAINYYGAALTIGNINSGRCDWWGGKIDELRFYNRALTQEEITYLANN